MKKQLMIRSILSVFVCSTACTENVSILEEKTNFQEDNLVVKYFF